MPNPGLSEEEGLLFIERVEAFLRDGHPPPGTTGVHVKGALRMAVESMGLASSSAAHRYHAAVKSVGRDVDWSIYKRPEPVLSPATRPPDLPPPDPEQRPTMRVRLSYDDLGEYTVVGIGDAHDGPLLPKDRFRWLGRFTADIKPDWVIQIGDMITLDSLCSYDKNDSLRGKSKPSFLDDIVSGHEALTAFDEGLNGYECKKHVTLGNHEDRIYSFTDRTPETAGMMQLELDRLFARHGWEYSPYGHPHFLGGVAFQHCAMSIMGRPLGGTLNNIANKATHDWVVGHDHRASALRMPKIGVNNHITILDLGCALPEGHIESYAKISTTGWWYGAWRINISRGRIHSYEQVTMRELEARYGD